MLSSLQLRRTPVPPASGAEREGVLTYPASLQAQCSRRCLRRLCRSTVEAALITRRLYAGCYALL